MWAELAPVGRSRHTGGYLRQPFTPADEEARAWFVAACQERDLRVERDGYGNLVGWWDTGDGPAVLTGSHLDSVVQGGAYDGPLGVVSALAAVDLLRERGVAPARPLGVAVFVEEEGSRFPLACLGSRLATGTTAWPDARTLRDRDGVALEELVDGAAGSSLLTNVAVYVELHVEQGRDLVHRDAPVGVGSGIWPHGRYRFDFRGRADHAGATRMEDRQDPMLTYAMTVLAANKQARLAGQRATFGRVSVEPNGTNAIPSQVTGWLDARASSTERLLELVAEVERQAVARAGRDGTDLVVTAESMSAEVAFDPALADRLARGLADPADGLPLPVIPTAAGHDAGVLAAAGIPTAMLFVRNPTGVSHSPDERAESADCLVGVHALADALAALTGGQA